MFYSKTLHSKETSKTGLFLVTRLVTHTQQMQKPRGHFSVITHQQAEDKYKNGTAATVRQSRQNSHEIYTLLLNNDCILATCYTGSLHQH